MLNILAYLKKLLPKNRDIVIFFIFSQKIKKMKVLKLLALAFFVIAFVFACKNNGEDNASTEGLVESEAYFKQLQEQLILAEDGATITIPEGKFLFSRSLTIEGKKTITIKGAGVGKTVLSFAAQTEGAEGINATNCDGIVMEDFTVQDSRGDNIKLKDCNNVILRNLDSKWTTGADSSNGNYGFYPVMCTNVLVEKCEVSYSADAGIYVGQSKNVIVRNCYAHHNVAGIEIENCINSDVYDNLAENNTGGLLVFDLPKLFQANGRNARIYNNKCINNNYKNFAKPGTIVSVIPPGTGMIVMATDSVDIFNNEIKDHKTTGIAIVSYFVTQLPINDTAYGPYCYSIYIHDNQITRKATLIPDLKSDLGKLVAATSKTPADIIYDGAADPKVRDANGNLPEDKKICIKNNGDVKFVNMNFWKVEKISDIIKTYDTNMEKFNCEIVGINGNNTKLN